MCIRDSPKPHPHTPNHHSHSPHPAQATRDHPTEASGSDRQQVHPVRTAAPAMALALLCSPESGTSDARGSLSPAGSGHAGSGTMATFCGAPVLCVDTCLLYTSDAADEEDSVDLGGRRIIKKKKRDKIRWREILILLKQ
eukprot:TRINITY_DN1504_c0_g1_i1.p1 TRINITY_DN1504_c0_g1~~TRINITY_DN1504_c0_g1_i1.p1  ORF type:complete len:148 (+),score=21.24 TRINITY_DN1504_c0_g1_i1:26-445(+)